MKRFVIFLLLGTLIALGYVIYKNGFYTEPPSEKVTYESPLPVSATATQPELKEALDEFADMKAEEPIQGGEVTIPEEAGGETTVTATTGTTDTERIRSIENLGSADAKTSTEYDHAGGELILFAEMKTESIVLEWNRTQSDAFTLYAIVRSTADENPYYPKTNAIVTLDDRMASTYTDTSVRTGTDYFYRICYTRSNNERAACGNILKITY